jgi:hypothetical protein
MKTLALCFMSMGAFALIQGAAPSPGTFVSADLMDRIVQSGIAGIVIILIFYKFLPGIQKQAAENSAAFMKSVEAFAAMIDSLRKEHTETTNTFEDALKALDKTVVEFARVSVATDVFNKTIIAMEEARSKDRDAFTHTNENIVAAFKETTQQILDKLSKKGGDA